MSQPDTVISNPWQALRQFTQARIALGRAGSSLPTKPLLDFQLAHAQARDAVHLPLDTQSLSLALHQTFTEVLTLSSAAPDRATYLCRPDLGRKLDQASQSLLAQRPKKTADVVFVLADGLSAQAVQQHAVPFLTALLPMIKKVGFDVGPACIVREGRVAVGDPIGEALAARLVVVLIGERPGLSSPDSLGLYMTYSPKVGKHDAERNCISNIRPAGQAPEDAAHLAFYLIKEALNRQLTGVALKDESVTLEAVSEGSGPHFKLTFNEQQN